MSTQSYAVVGVGGVGGYYGARLADAGIPVRWVARSDAEHLRTRGLRVESPRGDLHLDGLEVYGPDDAVPACDVVVVATKTLTNDELAERAVSLARPAGTVVVLQNGLDVEAPFHRAAVVAGAGVQVLGAMSFICAAKVGDGHIRHLDYEAVTVGSYDPTGMAEGVDAKVEAVVADFAAAGIPTEALVDLWEGRWRKLCWNIPFNGLSVVLDATTAEMVGEPDCRSVVVALMEEVVAAAAATGHGVPDDTIAKMLANTERMTPYAPSMKLDYDARRPLELPAIYETPLAAAAEAGAAMALTEALWRQLSFLDRRNRQR